LTPTWKTAEKFVLSDRAVKPGGRKIKEYDTDLLALHYYLINRNFSSLSIENPKILEIQPVLNFIEMR